jgi:hypothetical protein
VIRNLVHLLSGQLAVLSPSTILPYSNCTAYSSHLAEVVVTPMTQFAVVAAPVTRHHRIMKLGTV